MRISRELQGATELGYGSVHHALKSLEIRGLIREAGRARDPGTPERILYERTSEGVKSLAEAPWAQTSPTYGARLSGDGLYLAALRTLAPERRRALLEGALTQAQEAFEKLQGRIAAEERALTGAAEKAAPGGRGASLPAGLLLAKRHLQHLFAEITWIESVLEGQG